MNLKYNCTLFISANGNLCSFLTNRSNDIIIIITLVHNCFSSSAERWIPKGNCSRYPMNGNIKQKLHRKLCQGIRIVSKICKWLENICSLRLVMRAMNGTKRSHWQCNSKVFSSLFSVFLSKLYFGYQLAIMIVSCARVHTQVIFKWAFDLSMNMMDIIYIYI